MSIYAQYTNDLISALGLVAAMQPDIETTVEKVVSCVKSGGKLIFMGNGGSASDAEHLAAEFVGRYKMNRKAWPALALSTNSSAVTAISNDFGYENVFERQIEAFAQKGDCVFAISTSGNSLNVQKAMQKAQELGCFVIALSGKDGGAMKPLANINLIVKHNNTPRIQEVHIHIGHMICEEAEKLLAQQ